MAQKKMYILHDSIEGEMERAESQHYFEVHIQNGRHSEDQVAENISDYGLERGARLVEYELVPVAVYEVTNGFVRVA